MFNFKAFSLFAAGAVALATTPALAQKAQDTLRIAVISPFAILSTYDFPHEEAGAFSRDVYDSLLHYDEHKQTFVPALAKSWKRIDNKTLEFELRDDVKFHNGNKFEASDVKATVDYIIDPKSKITYPTRYNWVESVEVLGPHKVRVRAKEPTATDLMLLAFRFLIWDGKVLNAMSDRGDYSRVSPIGTGIFKVAQLDRNKGVIVERYDGYNVAPQYKQARIKRIHGIPMPDRETQAAQLMTGGIEVIRGASPDQAKFLAQKPDLEVTYLASPTIVYIALDSQNKSGNKALSDHRVRKAINKAIDRESIIKYIVPGGHIAEHIQAICFKATIACKYSREAEKFDQEGAKKLLVEAGYPNGFELSYDVFAPAKAVGEAVAGDLLKVGIRASLNVVDLNLYRRRQGDGKLQAWSILFPTGSYPDIGNIFSVYFTGPAFQYYDDPIISEAIKLGEAEFDPAKRAAIYGKALDRINEMNYILPISGVPTPYVHSKGVKVNVNKLSAGEVYVGDYAWK